MLKQLTLCIAVATLYGCANSASHQIVKPMSDNDVELSCPDIVRELRQVNAIIAGVEQDKKDMTGADVVDGLLWFPFNVIAKQSNYSSATKAAQARIETLTALKHAKECGDEPSDAELEIQSEKLKALNDRLQDGLITEDEYKTEKRMLLQQM